MMYQVATTYLPMQPVAPTRLEPGCIGIKIRLLSHRKSLEKSRLFLFCHRDAMVRFACF